MNNTNPLFDGLIGPQSTHAMKLLHSLYLNGIAMDHSETGCGKSYVASWIAKQFNAPTVLVAPKIILPKWVEVLKSFGVKPSVIINYEKLCRGNTPYLKYKKKEYIKKNNFESKGIKIKFPDNALVIADELHKGKGYDSLTSNFVMALKNQNYKVLGLSATMAMSVLDMKAFGFLTNLHRGENFNAWCKDHGAATNQYGGLSVEDQDKMIAGMHSIHNNLFNEQQISSRLTRHDMQVWFPAERILAESYDVGDLNTARINDAYSDMQRELAKLDSKTANYKAHVLAIIMKARRYAEMYKVPSIVEMAEDLYDEGISPVIFVNFVDTADAIISRLGNGKYAHLIGKIVGGQHAEQRQRHIEEFQSDKLRFMVCTSDAGNLGIDLHDLNGNFPRHSIISPGFKATVFLQCLGRICREGGLSEVIQKIFFAAGTIEERACERTQEKLNNHAVLNDDDLMAGIHFYD